MKFNSSTDGIDHINIYSKGKTELGRFLSNFSYSRIDTPYGPFDSVEGYWYYLLTPRYSFKAERLKSLTGFKAKELGRELTQGVDWNYSEEFKTLIKNAISCKINTMIGMADLLSESDLPFTHYYEYNGKVINVPENKWVLDHIEWHRKMLKIETEFAKIKS